MHAVAARDEPCVDVGFGAVGKNEAYNDVANWSYADLPKVFRRDTSAQSFVVRTVNDLEKVPTTPNDTIIFVESIMDPQNKILVGAGDTVTLAYNQSCPGSSPPH